jgi:hemolysin type calcium-binding protein
VGGIGSFSDYLDGGPGSDKLEGGGDRDFIYFRSAEWGNDTITGNGVSGSTDRVDFHSLSVALTIGLNSDSGTPEVTNAATTSTVNWSDNVIEQVVAGKGNDTITGNMIRGGYFNYIHGKGGDDLIMVNDGFGNDEVHCGENPDGSQDNDEVYYDAGDTVSNCETQHLG